MHNDNETEEKRLPRLSGTTVDSMAVDWRVSIRLTGDDFHADIVVSTDCKFSDGGHVHTITPEHPSTCSPLLAIIRKSVEAVVISKSGMLAIRLSGNGTLEVPPSIEFEAWQIATSDRTLMVCTPGGSVDVFSD